MNHTSSVRHHEYSRFQNPVTLTTAQTSVQSFNSNAVILILTIVHGWSMRFQRLLKDEDGVGATLQGHLPMAI